MDACEGEEEDQCGHCSSSYLSQGGALRARLETSLSNWPNFILAPQTERFGMQGQFAEEEGGAYDEEDEEEGGAMEDEEDGPIAPRRKRIRRTR